MDIQSPGKIELGDRAFFFKVQTDPGLRQALMIDTKTTLDQLAISPAAERKLRVTLELIDRLTGALAESWPRDAALRSALADVGARRVLLFAPREAAPVFEIPTGALGELEEIAEMANALFEVLMSQEETGCLRTLRRGPSSEKEEQ